MIQPDPKYPDFDLAQYFETHGAERTQGYLDALKQFQTEMDRILYYRYDHCGKMLGSPNTPPYVKKHLGRLHDEKTLILEKSGSFNLNPSQSDKPDCSK